MRWLSMSAVRSEQASEMRSPAPYAVIRIVRCLMDLTSSNRCSTSPPVKTSGKVLGFFGHGILATTCGRPSVVA
jgi:hypothetical protein